MEASAAAGRAADACVDACLLEGDVAELRGAIRLGLECADLCVSASRLLARSTDVEPRLLRGKVLACARASALCAAECERHARRHAHAKLCAQACRLSAERCEALLGELPDVHGGKPARLDARVRATTETVWRELSGQAP